MILIHIKRRKRLLATISTGGALLLVLLLLLWGCGKKADAPIPGADTTARVAYLESLGWQVLPQEVETLHLTLPEKLEGTWSDYAALQDAQGLPFSQFAGQTVHRYTYAVTNYPERTEDVQINLYLANDAIIGGDLIVLGEDGFRADLTFPKHEKAPENAWFSGAIRPLSGSRGHGSRWAVASLLQ